MLNTKKEQDKMYLEPLTQSEQDYLIKHSLSMFVNEDKTFNQIHES